MKIYGYYGHPHIIVTDQGSAFTSAKFAEYCKENNIKHVRTAVATPLGQMDKSKDLIEQLRERC